MSKNIPLNEHVEISSDDSSSSDGEDMIIEKPQNDEPTTELCNEAWLFNRAKSYQEYMSLIPVPIGSQTVIPCKSWTGLGKSMKMIYEQPLHYLTNIHLQEMDRARGSENVLLDDIIDPVKAETSVWIVEEVHRLSASPHQLLKMWTDDPMYHKFIDASLPKLPHQQG